MAEQPPCSAGRQHGSAGTNAYLLRTLDSDRPDDNAVRVLPKVENADVIENLMKLDFEVIPFDLPEAIRGQKFDPGSNPTNWMLFNRFRYTPVLEYLKANPGRFRNALWCDTRDLYFQTNPGDWMAANIHAPYRRLIGAAEGWLIKDQPHNAAWCKAVSLPDYEAWLKDEEVICTGTIAGDV